MRTKFSKLKHTVPPCVCVCLCTCSVFHSVCWFFFFVSFFESCFSIDFLSFASSKISLCICYSLIVWALKLWANIKFKKLRLIRKLKKKFHNELRTIIHLSVRANRIVVESERKESFKWKNNLEKVSKTILRQIIFSWFFRRLLLFMWQSNKMMPTVRWDGGLMISSKQFYFSSSSLTPFF